MRVFHLILALSAVGIAVVASAPVVYGYVGPGVGITLLGSLWAVVAAVILAIVGILLWPIRALLRRKRRAKEAAVEPRSLDA